MDVKTVFLNDELQEKVYVAQPKGFTVKNKEHQIYKLSKVLYGLRQAPRAWNLKLDKSPKNLGSKGVHKSKLCTYGATKVKLSLFLCMCTI